MNDELERLRNRPPIPPAKPEEVEILMKLLDLAKGNGLGEYSDEIRAAVVCAALVELGVAAHHAQTQLSASGSQLSYLNGICLGIHAFGLEKEVGWSKILDTRISKTAPHSVAATFTIKPRHHECGVYSRLMQGPIASKFSEFKDTLITELQASELAVQTANVLAHAPRSRF